VRATHVRTTFFRTTFVRTTFVRTTKVTNKISKLLDLLTKIVLSNIFLKISNIFLTSTVKMTYSYKTNVILCSFVVLTYVILYSSNFGKKNISLNLDALGLNNVNSILFCC